MNILGVIPARGGSKSVPRKNIKRLAGKPLIAYSIESAQQSRMLTRLILSTDDEEIADVGRRCGAPVPFIRPVELAQDETPDLPVFQHALTWLWEHEKYRPEMIVHLRPTSPFRAPEHIDQAIQLLLNTPNADSVRSVSIPGQTPFKMWTIGNDGFMKPLLTLDTRKNVELFNEPRQRLPKVYWQNACVDVTRYETIMEKRSMTGDRILPFLMEDSVSVDLDTEMDFQIAEQILQQNNPQD